ncbi:MAG TPA: hypothetical protein VLI93_04950, partial [Acetobacteraceae bacterium]|nr:hypothetical protein [Acetobacteraceae bacterium]
ASAIGIGMGFCNTTFIVSVQAHASWRERGAATSTSMFMRMVGQSLGAAVSGAVLDWGLPPDAAGAVDQLLNLSVRAGLPAADLARLVNAVAGSLRNVYVLAAVLAVATLLLMLRLPVGLSPREQEAAE